MHSPDAEIPRGPERTTGADSYGLLRKRDRVFHRTSPELALAEPAVKMRPARIDRPRRLVFRSSLVISALWAQDLAFRDMRKGAARRCRDSLRGQSCRTDNVGRGRICHFVECAAGKRLRQPPLRLGRMRIERQCSLEQAER